MKERIKVQCLLCEEIVESVNDRKRRSCKCGEVQIKADRDFYFIYGNEYEILNGEGK